MANAGPSLDFAGEIVLAAYVYPHDPRIDLGNLPRCHGTDRTPWIMEKKQYCLLAGRCEDRVEFGHARKFVMASVFHGMVPKPKAAHPSKEKVPAENHGGRNQYLHIVCLSLSSLAFGGEHYPEERVKLTAD